MSDQKPAALKISHLTKLYDKTHGIHDINLEVKQGEVFGFLGPNGAGKTTTINTVLDLLKPDQGTVSLLGLDHHQNVKEVHARLGYVSGDMETDPTLTGKQYLTYAAHLRGNVSKNTLAALVKRLQADTTTKIKHLSRGNKQKIGLIAALMHDPDILILDEPTSGLDPLMQAEFNTIIREQREKGKTTFISSHVLSEVQSICDRVGFIRNGTLIQVSTLSSLMTTALHKVSIHFKKSPPKSKFAQLAGVKDLEAEDDTLTFTFGGDINQLLKLLAEYPINNILITEPDLEELFMRYYRTEEA
jgi:ABC-2 type transport system ATP-binding protein